MPDNPIPGEDLEALAASLSPAQLRAVLTRRDLSSGSGMWPLRHALAEKGLVEGMSATWTPTAHALRAHLISRETPNAS